MAVLGDATGEAATFFCDLANSESKLPKGIAEKSVDRIFLRMRPVQAGLSIFKRSVPINHWIFDVTKT